jgi:hypothetical protein
MKIPAPRLAIALLLVSLVVLSPALSQSPPVPAALASVGFAPFTATFQPNISSGSLYQWQFNHVAGGDFIPDFTSESPSDVSFTYQREGDYVARVRIFDTATGAPTDYDVPVTVYPPPVPPQVSIVGSDPHTVCVGVPATFSATAVASPGLVIASYQWEFQGDGVAEVSTPGGPTSNATFAYPARGNYTVKVTAFDSFGLAGFATFHVQAFLPPTLSVEPLVFGDTWAMRGQPFSLKATATADTGRSIVAYRWDFDGDGVVDKVQASSAASDTQSFSFPQALVYVVKVTVVDDIGSTGIASVPVPVFQLLMSRAGPTPVQKGVSTTFSVTRFFPSGITATGYLWDFGDGATATTGPSGLSVSHVYNSGPWFEARVTATLSNGSSTSSPYILVPIAFTGSGPAYPFGISQFTKSASLTVPAAATVRVGHVANFSATAYAGSSEHEHATITQVAWDFDGDGFRDYVEDFTALNQLQVNSAAQYQYQYPGIYTVKVAMGTSYGQTVTASFPVTVTQGTAPVDVWMVQPANGRVVGGNHVTLSARGSPANNIASVTFQYRRSGTTAWTTIAKVVPPPATALSTPWNSKKVAPGSYDLQAVVAGTDGSTSTSWTIQPITVTVDPLVVSDDEETADDDGIPQVLTHVVDPNRPDRCEISQDTRVEFTAHSTPGSNYARCRIERQGEDPHPVETRFQGITFVPGLFRKLDLGSDVLTSPARLCLYVPTLSVEQALASAGISRAGAKNLELTIFRFDDIDTHSWVPLMSHVRQPAEDLVRASTMALGDVGVGFYASSSSRPAAGSGGSWSGCGALGVDGLLLVLLLARISTGGSKRPGTR